MQKNNFKITLKPSGKLKKIWSLDSTSEVMTFSSKIMYFQIIFVY